MLLDAGSLLSSAHAAALDVAMDCPSGRARFAPDNRLMLSSLAGGFSGLAILLLSFGFNLLGDALRDTLDPRLRRHE